jgi:serine phosphatase RsbU (regulator of sigma subunit)
VAKLAALPFGVRPGTTTGAGALPESDDYQSRAYSRPFERVGDFWFGGDWYGGYEAADGSLWVLLADVTGHGYFAYLLASTLPAVWRACCERVTHARPAHLLAAVHDVLADSLPEGIYAECTLVRLGKDGTATVVPAGGTRLLVRRNGVDQPVLHKLRGAWLGLARPSVEDESIWNLADGDELLLASDGCFDQLADHGDAVVERLTRPECLLDGVRNLLEAALAEAEQCDDITLVLLRRRGRSDDLLSSEAGDVRL